MINDIRFAKTKEQSLDDWIDETVNTVDEIIYQVMLEINQVLGEVSRYAR
ncbi:unnamed protein product [marine sediment metagenome]|uniref:Uncharacterized protein n=1 Tax=marine sediment metagenome TaxID=412755 RepID=X1HR62_9ZZZZ